MNKANLQSEFRNQIEGLRNARVNYELLAAACTEKISVLESAQGILMGGPAATKVAATATASTGQINWGDFDGSSIHGLSKIDAMVEMTRYAGGKIRAEDLADGMLFCGLYEGTTRKRAVNNVYGSLNSSSSRFRRVAPGTYRLV